MNQKEIPETKIHSYNVSVAVDVGINAAIIFHNICFWVEQNFANERNFINDDYWTYNTVNAFKTMFPEMTYEQIRNALRKLEDKKYIKSAFLSEDVMDRTKYYAVVDFEKWISKNKCKCEFSHMDSESSQMDNGNGTDVNNIYNNISIDTDNNFTNDKQTDNNVTDNSHKGKNINAVNGEVKTSSSENRKKMPAPKTALEKYLGKKADEQDMMKRLANICISNYDEETAKEIFETIEYYFRRYTEKEGKIHPILTDKTLKLIAEKMDCFYDSEYSHFERLIGQDHAFIKMADMFFDGDFGLNKGNATNYHLPAFMTDGVLNRLGQRLFELGEVK